MGKYKLNPLPTAELLRHLFDYDHLTGIFVWRNPNPQARHIKVGQIAGCLKKDGYVHIKVDNVRYPAHRLAWMYHYGTPPSTHDLDHISGNPSDNSIANLRESTRSQNQANRAHSRNNKLGIKGVTFHKGKGKFIGQIRFNGKLYHLGQFDTSAEASASYAGAASILFGHFAHGGHQ